MCNVHARSVFVCLCTCDNVKIEEKAKKNSHVSSQENLCVSISRAASAMNKFFILLFYLRYDKAERNVYKEND